jgi:hypothetical protein
MTKPKKKPRARFPETMPVFRMRRDWAQTPRSPNCGQYVEAIRIINDDVIQVRNLDCDGKQSPLYDAEHGQGWNCWAPEVEPVTAAAREVYAEIKP